MRIIIIALIISLFIFSFCFYSANVLQKTTDELIQDLAHIEEFITAENWHKAEKYMDLFEKSWEENKFIWSVLIDHREIDNIQISIVHIKSFIKTKNLSQVKAEIAGLNLYLKHIPEIEKLNLENIL